jgi:ATP-dependent Clp protease ATP-binding subunit ClpB
VFNVLLQVLDDGRITDSAGRTVDFKNTILILTSNIGSSYLLEGIENDGDITQAVENDVMDELKAHFRPEFLNRLDEILLFRPLSESSIAAIMDLQVAHINKVLEPQQITVSLDNAAKALIVKEAYDPLYGARPLKRYLQKTVETLLAKLILSGGVKEMDTVVITESNGKLVPTVN